MEVDSATTTTTTATSATVSEVMVNFSVKWNGKTTTINIPETSLVFDVKNILHEEWGVLPKRQKLLGLKYNGKLPTDDIQISLLKIKNGSKIMMMGSLEEDLEELLKQPDEPIDVIDDFAGEDEELMEIARMPANLAKIKKRIKNYQIKVTNPPRPGKKLLVLDIDYTLYDHKSTAENIAPLQRPYLHEFLTSAYQNYDIAIWSATGMNWIELKMKEMGVTNHPDYKIVFYVDSGAMISVLSPKYGVVSVKPLGVIWGKFSEYYSPRNTIMFDDCRHNFLMNPRNGLRIRPCRKLPLTRDQDTELLKLSQYLLRIAELQDNTFLHLIILDGIEIKCKIK